MNRSSRSGGGFTITELLVVIVIFVLVIGIAIPAFTSMVQSSERSLAENQLRVGLSSARDAAIQSPASDAAAVFFFQPGGRVSIVPCISVGFLEDDENSRGTATGRRGVSREVFVPLATAAPIQLPRNWGIRAYTPANTVSGTDVTATGDANGWYDSLAAGTTSPAADGHWLFPETNFINPAAANAGATGWQRQTFMVRFRNGTGELDAGNRALALVIDPVAAQNFRQTAPFSATRLDQASDLAAAVNRLLEANLTGTQRTDRIKLLGDVSIDSILARPVTELAVYNERSLTGALAQTLGARGTNRATGTSYADPATTEGPELDASLFAGTPDLLAVNRTAGLWIEGRLADAGGDVIETDSRIFTLQRYLGQAQEVVD